MVLIRFGIAVLAAVALASTAACSHAPSPDAPATPATPPPPCTTPEPLRISLQASARINPGEKGEALATVVRVYQLKGTGKLQGAGFDDILDRDKETLGDEMVAVSEVTINPGDKMDPPVARNPEAVYVAAVALFRRPAGNTWRGMKKLAPPDPQHCQPGGAAKRAAAAGGIARFVLDENRIDLR